MHILFKFFGLELAWYTTYIICLQIKMQNVTRLCHTKRIVTVNGEFPGPQIVAREGDRLEIEVINHVHDNISIHW